MKHKKKHKQIAQKIDYLIELTDKIDVRFTFLGETIDHAWKVINDHNQRIEKREKESLIDKIKKNADL